MEDGEIVEGVGMEDEAQLPPKIEKSPYQMLQESKASVEEIVANILSIKKQSSPKSQLRELVTQMFLHFVTLRQVPHIIVSIIFTIFLLKKLSRVRVLFCDVGKPVHFARGGSSEGGDRASKGAGGFHDSAAS